MDRKGKEKEVSGWYAQKEQTAEETAAQMRATERWYEKKQQPQLPDGSPGDSGKDDAGPGEDGRRSRVSFSEFIEEILQRYLRQKKINWKTPKMKKGK